MPTMLQFQMTSCYQTSYIPTLSRAEIQQYGIQRSRILNDPAQFKQLTWKSSGCYIILFGRTENGTPVCVRVPYQPFVFLELPSFEVSDEECQRIVQSLTDAVFSGYRKPKLKWERVSRHRSMYWQPDLNNLPHPKLFPMLKIYIPNSYQLRTIDGLGRSFPYPIHEAITVDVCNKFLDEAQMRYFSWVEIDTQKFPNCEQVISRAVFEHHVSSYRDVRVLSDRDFHAPLVVLSFDLECKRSDPNTYFCDAKIENDIIFGIGSVIGLSDKPPSSWKKHFFEVGPKLLTQTDIQLHSYADEFTMMEGWMQFVLDIDPDIIISYNGHIFDLAYIVQRFQNIYALAGHDYDFQHPFWYWSKIWFVNTPAKCHSFESRAHGFRPSLEMRAPGRILMDVLEVVRRESKLSSYTLDDVSALFLHKQKDDLSKSDLNAFMDGTNDQKEYIRKYCVQDCMLPFEIAQVQQYILNTVSMSNVTLTSAQDVLNRGQQEKSMNMIAIKMHQFNYVIVKQDATQNYKYGQASHTHDENNHDDEDDAFGDSSSSASTSASTSKRKNAYQGGCVLEAQTGYYTDPVATLDFNSLYPSIMIAHNMCYTTLVDQEEYKNLPGVNYQRIVVGQQEHSYVEDCPGVLPAILVMLLAERSKVKKLMEAAYESGNATLGNLLKAKQLCLKLSANSLYGFTGATLGGRYPCIPISSSVTAVGRRMIQFSKKYTEDHLPHTQVIYGDTDSIMIRMLSDFFVSQGIDLKDDLAVRKFAFQQGSKLAKEISTQFRKPINLEMEKMFERYLLLSKKRYAGVAYEKPDKKPKLKVSGMETVRRDVAPFCQNLQKNCLNALMSERDILKAVRLVGEQLDMLVNDQVPFDDYVLTCQLRNEYANEHLLQVQVVKKIKQRTGQAPTSGDRLRYVFVVNAAEQAYLKGEEASYAKENKIPIDREYYLRNKCQKPMEAVLSLFIPGLARAFDLAATQIKGQQLRFKSQGQYRMQLLSNTSNSSISCLKFLEKAIVKSANDSIIARPVRSEQTLASFFASKAKSTHGELKQDTRAVESSGFSSNSVDVKLSDNDMEDASDVKTPAVDLPDDDDIKTTHVTTDDTTGDTPTLTSSNLSMQTETVHPVVSNEFQPIPGLNIIVRRQSPLHMNDSTSLKRGIPFKPQVSAKDFKRTLYEQIRAKQTLSHPSKIKK